MIIIAFTLTRESYVFVKVYKKNFFLLLYISLLYMLFWV